MDGFESHRRCRVTAASGSLSVVPQPRVTTAKLLSVSFQGEIVLAGRKITPSGTSPMLARRQRAEELTRQCHDQSSCAWCRPRRAYAWKTIGQARYPVGI